MTIKGKTANSTVIPPLIEKEIIAKIYIIHPPLASPGEGIMPRIDTVKIHPEALLGRLTAARRRRIVPVKIPGMEFPVTARLG
jgi:hypothetical protein